MKDSRHRRERSLGLPPTGRIDLPRSSRCSPPPLKGILKKTSRFEHPSQATPLPANFSLITETLSTTDTVEKPRLSPRDNIGQRLLAAMGKAMETVKVDLKQQEEERMEARRQRVAAAMQALGSMKMPGKEQDQSLVVMQDSGSETERGTVTSNRPSLRVAIQTLAAPQYQSDLLSLVEATGTPRLSLLMHGQEVTGLYSQIQGGWKKIYGGKEAPTAVESSQVTECYEVKDTALTPISKKCLWRADVFRL